MQLAKDGAKLIKPQCWIIGYIEQKSGVCLLNPNLIKLIYHSLKLKYSIFQFHRHIPIRIYIEVIFIFC